ncbi:formylglycine-generating enzyme family protein [Polyangium mundeleinium]|uniref:SUMF1/EgtB/PvdO family nonheme iron enzyme n=1 Tax=Polyangium mundeleinium TaxID=2995306 RepID=A0ABT5EWH7_9BACT|nr:SUMF1/EgtB/PvdO family nonheme iron enzyme [Polyangium mundeleinium]MDC0746150.1 SUMF1/EgtB/PvdO family nonheme iron enzyme [Polyangium mundeleinium]
MKRQWIGGIVVWSFAAVGWLASNGPDEALAQPKPAPAKPTTSPAKAPSVVEVRLEGGTFQMGDRYDTVTVAPFFLDDIEVTVGAYGACVDAGQCTTPNTGKYCNWGEADRQNHPINCVDWFQAEAYCKSQQKRLPTEEEWEWAARGGSRANTYPWGEDTPLKQLCWNGPGNDKGEMKRASTCPVGSYPRGNTPQKIKDLGGNVWEWTSSKYRPEEEHLVIRGTSWLDDLASAVRVAFRVKNMPKDRYSNIGFRCARSP